MLVVNPDSVGRPNLMARSSVIREPGELPLVATIVVPMGPVQRRAVERIDAEDFSSVLKKVRAERQERGLSTDDAYLKRGERALRQYHVVAILDPRNEHAISDTLDPFWHAQILHTRQYARFCDETMGHFIHHEPLDHADVDAVAHLRRLYPYTCARITEIFGGAIESEFFPNPVPDERLVCRHCQCFNEALLAETTYAQVFSCQSH